MAFLPGSTEMRSVKVGGDISTGMSQTGGCGEQISQFSKIRLVARGAEGVLSHIPSLPEMGWLFYLGGTWTVVQGWGSGPGAIQVGSRRAVLRAWWGHFEEAEQRAGTGKRGSGEEQESE